MFNSFKDYKNATPEQFEMWRIKQGFPLEKNEIDGEIVFVGDTLATDIKLANEFINSINELSFGSAQIIMED